MMMEQVCIHMNCYSYTTQKIHSESITDLNAIPKTIKHPEENTRENHHEPGLGEIYWL